MANRTLPQLFVGTGTALDIYGSVADGESAYRAGQYNARAASGDADYMEQTGVLTQRQMEREGRKFAGKQVADFASMRTALNGSAMDIMADTLAQIELQKVTSERENARKVASLRDEAGQSRAASSNARQQGFLKASGKLFKGAKDIYDMF